MILDAQGPERNHIFISYRRDDARGASGRLYDWLRIGFGRERVFRDVQSIGVGKWRDKIDAALARSAVCVVVIGPRWANADNLLRLHSRYARPRVAEHDGPLPQLGTDGRVKSVFEILTVPRT
jgi:TIR domain